MPTRSSQTTSFTVPGEGVAKGRPRLNRKTMTLYTPKTTKVYEECVGLVAKASRATYNKEIALAVQIVIYTAKKSPPDGDNIEKSILDGMQRGGLIEDDSQVCNCHWRVVRSDNPRVEVLVTPTMRESEGE